MGRSIVKLKRRGFTLVELLVVLGLIALLIGLMLPMVSKVRDGAASVKCLSNLRQIGHAFQLYANDHNGCLVPGDYVGLADGSATPGAGSWADILAGGGYVSAASGTYSAISMTADFVAASWRDSIFRCPAGQEFDAADAYPTSQTDARGTFYFARGSDTTLSAVFTWYAANCTPRLSAVSPSQVLRPLPFNFLPDYASGRASWVLNRLSHLKHSPALIFDGVWCFNDDPARINARHGNRHYTNVLYADGHAESELTSSLPNENWYLR